MLPFGEGQKFLPTAASATLLLGGWSITPVITLQSGFPIGVSQNLTGNAVPVRRHAAAERRAGQDFLVAGDITDRITREHRPTTCTSTRPRSRRRRPTVRQRAAHAARRLLAVAQQRRPVGQQERQDRRRDVGVDPARSAEHVQHRAVGGAGELGVRQLGVRPDQQPGEQHADDAVHAAVRVLEAGSAGGAGGPSCPSSSPASCLAPPARSVFTFPRQFHRDSLRKVLQPSA